MASNNYLSAGFEFEGAASDCLLYCNIKMLKGLERTA